MSNVRKRKVLSLRQRQRRRPSRIKTPTSSAATPSERLRIALELSDLCLALREAAQEKN